MKKSLEMKLKKSILKTNTYNKKLKNNMQIKY